MVNIQLQVSEEVIEKFGIIKILLSICLVLVQLPLYCYGLSDYSTETPGGNRITDNGGGSFLETKNNTQIQYLHKWYFYHNFIIGEYSKSANEKVIFFVLDEESGVIKTFSREVEWKNYLHQTNLVPSFWTRWYGYDWTQGVLFILFLYNIFLFFIVIPIEIVVLIFFLHKMIGVFV